jgi:hypothetical protein
MQCQTFIFRLKPIIINMLKLKVLIKNLSTLCHLGINDIYKMQFINYRDVTADTSI